ncbi:hypothetical protein [Actinobacillus lignieresii]|uniref:Uncharacterized protein n=1 Tax=Actinobacillus lignieresii TaxID=720 RepID=A0A380TVA6_ACTLI|nr:hypothetical protein [Actinobacillus lignieresii]SUT92570.1 Uncharacterised protein [Actinobacillus lignieresii]
MKQTFIQNLKNGQVPFLENEKAFAELPQDLFEPLNTMLVTIDEHEHHWSEEYFNAKVVDLDFNFSKELVLHLIAVKNLCKRKTLFLMQKVRLKILLFQWLMLNLKQK